MKNDLSETLSSNNPKSTATAKIYEVQIFDIDLLLSSFFVSYGFFLELQARMFLFYQACYENVINFTSDFLISSTQNSQKLSKKYRRRVLLYLYREI